jgi:hypothetical protein
VDSAHREAPADRTPATSPGTSARQISKEHAMSPFIMIDLVRAIDDDRRRTARPARRFFRRSAR